jgi:MFS family permease
MTAPILLIALRLLQGLALGGEYGGAATYVAEHAPQGKRGLYTSWIQTTATLGLFLSLLVILFTRQLLGGAFDTWGWRIPFLASVVLLIVSVYIRMQLAESPVFLEMKSAGTRSKAPLTESFARWGNLRIVIFALLGATAGEGVVWYAGQFYALFFLTQILKVDAQPVNLLIAAALIIATPFFVVFGKLSDRIGRKKIILIGCLLAAVTYVPIFKGITHYANPAIERAAANSPVTVIADPNACSFQFDPVGKTKFTKSCDVAKGLLAKAGVPYSNEAAPAGALARVRIGSDEIPSFEGASMSPAEFKEASGAFTKMLGGKLKDAGYPAKADPAQINYPMVLLLLVILVLYVTMVYGPIAAWLVELFPARIRYTSMSLPYHIGNGWFGGFLPPVAFALVALTGNIYYGLWYPIIVALMTVVIGALFLPETKDRRIQ